MKERNTQLQRQAASKLSILENVVKSRSARGDATAGGAFVGHSGPSSIICPERSKGANDATRDTNKLQLNLP